MDNRPIGVFDSGVGGLTVVDEIQKRMPMESIVYAGDTARVPYGGKDKETLMQYGREIIRFLMDKHDAKAIVFACGTTSSNVFTELQNEFPDYPLIDVIRPGAQTVADLNPDKVGFIATEATVRSGMFTRLLHEKKPGIIVEARACPLFVPLIEEGWVDNGVTRLVVETYLEDLSSLGFDTIVLGCTHYPMLSDMIKKVLGDITLINMAEHTVQVLHETLEKKAMQGDGKPKHRFFVSGYTDKFEKMAQMILGKEYKAVKTEWV